MNTNEHKLTTGRTLGVGNCVVGIVLTGRGGGVGDGECAVGSGGGRCEWVCVGVWECGAVFDVVFGVAGGGAEGRCDWDGGDFFGRVACDGCGGVAVSGVGVRGIFLMLGLQVRWGFFSLGVMRSCGKWAVGILAVVGVVMPVVGYVGMEFFGSGGGWLWGVPGFAVARVAGGQVGAGFWWAVGSYFFVGMGIMGMRRILQRV